MLVTDSHVAEEEDLLGEQVAHDTAAGAMLCRRSAEASAKSPRAPAIWAS